MGRRTFGPVPSRRLGKSLGVNNIPHKICTFQCIYCQVGKAIKMQVNRQEFYKPEKLVDEVKAVLGTVQHDDQSPDFITIVPDGEPTLDIHLGELIDQLKILKIPVAVITNASLIHLPDVQQELLRADYVSVKADTFYFDIWKRINSPHKKLGINEIMHGIQSFAHQFSGKLVTETMLIKGMNDSYDELLNTAKYIESFGPDTAYLAIPTRPPASPQAIPADEITVTQAYHIFKERIEKVELLIGYEGNAFSSTGDFREDILSITAVHPMREDAVMELLHKTESDEDSLNLLLEEKLIEKIRYSDFAYYLRRYSK
ncbi:MAG: radical SAM protein [Lentimicrobiaceae bacterium]|nr:radical SAM protein [Lentimicrobiaceae bacterium]